MSHAGDPEVELPPGDESRENSKADDDSPIPSNLIQHIPEEIRPALIQHLLFYREQYSGPIAHPRIVAGYEKYQSGSADRILTLAEEQQRHRFELESLGLEAAIQRDRRGTYLGFMLSMAIIAMGIYAIAVGVALAGVAVVGGTAATVAGVYVYSHRSSRQELREKRAALKRPAVAPALGDQTDGAEQHRSS